ncbi:N-acetylglucosamine kinase [Cohaesibacter sp. CAU 1516]|uniref:BadF/BadG/BcrA/BcrD ATPase family protein n=1 Tax=Cohaesibacter sp. CAU 1516 TaxID=2576038 RepID=UPI0010FD3584|nr:BadF/BadG/BcrA/BcrD ATPase family protein [Cohaesibacter sp. CAU 1516]TLP44969.1 N-acetylglucosamine kinase [Cohaesibacter sp. CAU 1516]
MTDAFDYYLGIDGGGTGSRGRLRSKDGTLLGEAAGGPANTRLGVVQSQMQVDRIAREAIKAAGLPEAALKKTSAGIGLAGLHILADKEAFLEWEHPFGAIQISSDAHVACLGAHQGARDGGIMIIGTGSCGYGLVSGHSVNVGGWGFTLSDLASAAQVGLSALRYAIAALDGIYEVSPMTDQIMFRFSDSQEEMVLWTASATPAHYGEFAKLVVEYADRDDPVAVKLMSQCGSEASAIMRALAWRGINDITLMGSFAEKIEPWLEADVNALLVDGKHDAQDGAILLAGGRLPPPTMEH